jgi:hypothetical protein
METYFGARSSRYQSLSYKHFEFNDDFRDGFYRVEKGPKWIDQVVDEVVEIGHDLLERNPHGKMVMIGQSPAPSGRAAEIEAGYRYLNPEVVNLPFSYRIFDFSHTSADLPENAENKTGDDAWREMNADPEGIFYYRPLEKRERTIEKFEDAPAAYEKTLKLYNLLPEDIVEYHEQTGEKVTFADISRTVRGGASLAYILLDLAAKEACEKDLRKAVDFRVYLDKTLSHLIERPSGLAVPGFDPLPCSGVEIGCMFSIYAIGATPQQGRMVAEYPPENWADLPGPAEGTPEYLEHMEQSIHTKVVDFLNERNLLPKQKVKARQSCNLG